MSAVTLSSPPADAASWARPFQGASLRDVVLRRDALPDLGPMVLLHAGPPFEGEPPRSVRNACVQALLFEGLAADEAHARAMLSTGAVELRPAQDHGVVTPLAQVVSASMPMTVVGDAASIAWAPLVEGPPPALRFGTEAPEARSRLAAIADFGLQRLAPLLRAQPVALSPIVLLALAQGDECHARTGAANAALVEAIAGLADDDRAALQANPGFVLTILMAAASWRLRLATRGLAAVGGNGIDFGLRMHGASRWHRCPATPPMGTRMPGHADTEALGAIGDSAVIDFCGLGGQALAAAPALLDEWRNVLPDALMAQRAAVVDPVTGRVDIARVAASGVAPCVDLAILDRQGTHGLIGRGVYQPDMVLFVEVEGAGAAAPFLSVLSQESS
jgi:hypothetical protein